MTNENWSGIRVLLTDIDDTITTDGRLTAEAYSALEAAQSAGYIVIPVTGRCAGWCDHIARMWPVDAVVGENGAFYFRYDHTKKKMHQYFCQSKTERSENARKLKSISTNILKLVPGTAIASDQPYRITDLAIDFAEDVEPLPRDALPGWAISRTCTTRSSCETSKSRTSSAEARYGRLLRKTSAHSLECPLLRVRCLSRCFWVWNASDSARTQPRDRTTAGSAIILVNALERAGTHTDGICALHSDPTWPAGHTWAKT